MFVSILLIFLDSPSLKRLIMVYPMVYHRVEHPMNKYLEHFVAARNARTLAALGEMALVISHCRTNQFSR